MKIEKGIPMPKSGGKYSFAEMDVGDSVFFAGATSQGKEYIASQQVGRRLGRKFSVRAVDGGARIWRVA